MEGGDGVTGASGLVDCGSPCSAGAHCYCRGVQPMLPAVPIFLREAENHFCFVSFSFLGNPCTLSLGL